MLLHVTLVLVAYASQLSIVFAIPVDVTRVMYGLHDHASSSSSQPNNEGIFSSSSMFDEIDLDENGNPNGAIDEMDVDENVHGQPDVVSAAASARTDFSLDQQRHYSTNLLADFFQSHRGSGFSLSPPKDRSLRSAAFFKRPLLNRNSDSTATSLTTDNPSRKFPPMIPSYSWFVEIKNELGDTICGVSFPPAQK
jgi:hypothetical protein